MIAAYIGNFVPDHSTENHLRQAWERQGHTVIRVQEGELSELQTLMQRLSDVDLVLWTRTGDLAAKVGHRAQWELLTAAKKAGVPTVGFHLDRWWGLDREHLVWEEPFFRCEYLITADGGHQRQFSDVGINHFWLPPAISLGETEPGTPNAKFTSNLAFVGSWQPGYHKEWKHRPELVTWLQRQFPRDIKFWPRPGENSIRGQDLRDLYASVKVVIGDSCLVGGATHYWSDRIPETLGRGGFLIHPNVPGIEEHFTDGEHLLLWEVGNWSQLKEKIQWALANIVERQQIAEAGRAHVISKHTYDTRVNQILELISK